MILPSQLLQAGELLKTNDLSHRRELRMKHIGVFKLPDLEERLQALAEGELCRISNWDYERLFGSNDAALGRLRNFAKLHTCVASFDKTNGVLFRKELQQP